MPDFPNVNNPFFQTPVPITFQMQAAEEAARRRATLQVSASTTSGASTTTSTSSTTGGTTTSTTSTGGSGGTASTTGSLTPAQAFQNLQGAVTALGTVLSQGQNVNQALGNLAQVLAAFTQAVSQPQSGSQTTPPPRPTNPNANPAPAPPLGIAPPNPRSQHIELPPGSERAGLPPQPPMKPEPPIGLYAPSVGAPSFWTA